jgi:hypothetical protein
MPWLRPMPAKYLQSLGIRSVVIRFLRSTENAMNENVGILVSHWSNIHDNKAIVCAGCHIAVVSSLRDSSSMPVSPGTPVPSFYIPRLRHFSDAGDATSVDAGPVDFLIRTALCALHKEIFPLFFTAGRTAIREATELSFTRLAMPKARDRKARHGSAGKRKMARPRVPQGRHLHPNPSLASNSVRPTQNSSQQKGSALASGTSI